MPKFWSGCFLFFVHKIKSPTPAPADNPATKAGKDKVPYINNSTSKTDDAQFGISPITLAIKTWRYLFVVRTFAKASVPQYPMIRFITNVAIKM